MVKELANIYPIPASSFIRLQTNKLLYLSGGFYYLGDWFLRTMWSPFFICKTLASNVSTNTSRNCWRSSSLGILRANGLPVITLSGQSVTYSRISILKPPTSRYLSHTLKDRCAAYYAKNFFLVVYHGYKSYHYPAIRKAAPCKK